MLMMFQMRDTRDSPPTNRILAVLDFSRAISPDDAGVITAIFTGTMSSGDVPDKKARKVLRKHPNTRLVELRPYRNWAVGDHISPMTDIQTPLDAVREDRRKVAQDQRVTDYCRKFGDRNEEG
jgi:hypothetical protein